MVNTNKLKGRLKERNLTQADCAKTLNIKNATFCQKINNIRAFTLDEAEKLACFLEIENEKFAEYFFSQAVA